MHNIRFLTNPSVNMKHGSGGRQQGRNASRTSRQLQQFTSIQVSNFIKGMYNAKQRLFGLGVFSERPSDRSRTFPKKLSNLSCRTVLAHLEFIIKSKPRRARFCANAVQSLELRRFLSTLDEWKLK